MNSDPLAAGEHVLAVDGRRQWYHLAGRGTVCLVHPGGPGNGWQDLRMPALEARLTVSTPAPLLLGHYDFVCGPRWALSLAAAIPGARLVTFDGSRHMAHLEKADAFAAPAGSTEHRWAPAGSTEHRWVPVPAPN